MTFTLGLWWLLSSSLRADPYSKWPVGLDTYLQDESCPHSDVWANTQQLGRLHARYQQIRESELCTQTKIKDSFKKENPSLCPGVTSESIKLCLSRVVQALEAKKQFSVTSFSLIQLVSLMYMVRQKSKHRDAQFDRKHRMIEILFLTLELMDKRTTPNDLLFGSVSTPDEANELKALQSEDESIAKVSIKKTIEIIEHTLGEIALDEKRKPANDFMVSWRKKLEARLQKAKIKFNPILGR